MPHCPYRLSLLGAITFGSLLAAQAHGADTALELQAQEITAAAIDRNESVEAEQLQRYQASDLQEVFESNPEVSVAGGPGVAQKLYLRGLEDTLLNISIDGASQPGQTFHHTGRIGIEPELLKRAEVQAGTGDATAGPGALGGAIRFVTKDPDDLLRDGEQLGALLKTGYFSNGEGYKSSASVFGRFNQNWSALAMTTYQDQNDFEDGNNDDVLGTAARQKLGFAKLVGKLTDEQTLRLSYEKRIDEGERSQRPQWIPSSFNRLYPLSTERETWTLNYAWQPVNNDLLDVELTTYHTTNELEQDGRFGLYFGDTRSTGFDLRNTSRIGAHQLTYGVDLRDDRTTLGPEGDRELDHEDGEVLGVYLQDRYQITSRLQLDAGLRWTTASNAYWSALPSMNLVAEITPDFLVRLGAAKVMTRPGLGSLTPGVTVNVSTREAVMAGYDNARKFRDDILVERFMPGNDFRLLVDTALSEAYRSGSIEKDYDKYLGGTNDIVKKLFRVYALPE